MATSQVMWTRKGCQRCGGDTYQTTDDEGFEVMVCIMCGPDYRSAFRRPSAQLPIQGRPAYEIEEALLAS